MTENEANGYLEYIASEFIDIFQNESGFRYLAIVKNKFPRFPKYFLEFSYSNKLMSDERANEIIEEIKKDLPVKVSISPIFSFLKNGIEKRKKKKIKFKNKSSNKTFEYEKNIKLQVGDSIFGALFGTLGAFISLHNMEDYTFLLSNYHVIMNDNKINEPIYNIKNEQIASLYWGLFNNKYDVAIAKIKENILINNNVPFTFNEIVNINKPTYKLEKVKSYSASGLAEKGVIYSKNTIIKLKKKTYINQILIKNLNLNKGDSGSIVVEDTNKKSEQVVGLFMASETGGNLRIANNLYNLFNSEIKSKTDNQKRELPKIHFKNFINNLNTNYYELQKN